MDAAGTPGPLSNRARRALKTALTSSLVMAALCLALELKLLLLPSAVGGVPFGALYGGAYFAMLVLSLGSAALAQWGRWPWLPLGFSILMVAFGVGLTWIDLHSSPEYLAYTIASFGLALVYSGRSWVYAGVLGGSFLALVALVAWTLPGRLDGSDLVLQGILVVLAFAGCQVLEGQRREAETLAQRLEDLNGQLREAAIRDALTGLYNRRFLVEFLAGKRALSIRMGMPLSVVLIDLDHFKSVNDRLGHLTGDAVLKEFAQRLLEGIRESDLAARYGGEEFLLILPQADAANAALVTNRILEAVRTQAFPGVPWALSFSAGISDLRPGDTAELLVERADLRLYRAKRTRNTVVWADETAQDPSQTRPVAPSTSPGESGEGEVRPSGRPPAVR